MRKIIMFQGGVETLSYFSREIGRYFTQKGYSIFFFDLEQAKESARKVKKFIKFGETCLLTFNFLGLSQEEGCYEDGLGYLWEQYQIPCFNIVVDHPLYYKERYEQLPSNYYQISIDRNHMQYMKEYYNELQADLFLPLAGNKKETVSSTFEETFGTMQEWLDKRPVDIMFAGNYQIPEQYETYITRINDEYTAFYRGMIEELLTHSERTLEEVAKKHCMREMGQLSIEEWRICFQHLNFIDLYLRFTVRKKAIAALLKAGLTVDVYGHGYEDFDYEGFDQSAKKRLRIHGPLDTKGCLQAMEQSKISLNVMPWFKDGAHDRIFSTMLHGGVSVTDDSVYLKETLHDKKEVLFYNLQQFDDMVQVVKELLACPDNMYQIASQGYLIAAQKHTWENRAAMLETYMLARI